MTKRYLCFNLCTRAELVLARQYAEFHGYQPKTVESAKRIEDYAGGPCCLIAYFNPLLKKNNFRLVCKSDHRIQAGPDLVVSTLDEFKHSLDTFYHDGYLDDDNFKV